MFEFFFVCFLLSLFAFFFKMSHLLSCLISLEMLSVFLIFFMLSGGMIFDGVYLLFFFLTLSVCESILGLILFVMFVFFFSKDYVFSMNLLLL